MVALIAAALACAAGAAPARADAPPDTVEMRLVAPLAADSLPRDGAEAFPVTLASFTTTLEGSLEARTDNVRLASHALDGVVLDPGQVLSFNAAVGPRTRDRGYRDAPVILREARELEPGGGVCQVASTLFAASLLAGLSPVERWRHSTPVDYIAPGEDATIAWGAKDLRVRNDLAQRVRVRAEVTGTALTVRVDGEGPARDSYELAIETRAIPADPGAPGGAAGREIDLYRVRLEDGAEVERAFVHRDLFPPSRGARRDGAP